jgi:hypothetical protein
MNTPFNWSKVAYQAKISDGIGLVYLFDAHMTEIGYHIGDFRVLTHSQGRSWSPEALQSLILSSPERPPKTSF